MAACVRQANGPGPVSTHVHAVRRHDRQLAEAMSYAPDRGGGVGAQQPGSPGLFGEHRLQVIEVCQVRLGG